MRAAWAASACSTERGEAGPSSSQVPKVSGVDPSRVEVWLELNVVAHIASAQYEGDRFLDDFTDTSPRFDRGTSARKCQKLLSEISGPEHSVLEAAHDFAIVTFSQDRQVTEYDHQQIVEVVGNAARKGSERP